MVESVDESRTRQERASKGPERVYRVALDPVAAAHLRVLAQRDGVTPEEAAARLVSQRLRAMVAGLTEGGAHE